ncbi:hypothetical protein [Chitinimonas sp. BJYL2]|uniref:protein kinase domain-containing protein n=1 Tax=Chitinimonas sp. BJYL2 TaxID=2976696 RepID=UPI0022B5D74D|nr:hypothetical protein [Chitinimonas sp. BJYL2]
MVISISSKTSLSPSALSLIRRLGIDTIDGRYRADENIGNSFGGTTFSGTDVSTGQRVFFKYLICPRGEGERAKFLMERDALVRTRQFPGEGVAPEVLHFEQFDELQSMVLVTEWVDGELLSDWLARAHTLDVEKRLEVFHRIAVAMSKATLSFQHRDFHPGNIILLPEDQVHMGPTVGFRDSRSAVMVLDWGEALPVIMGSYDDEPDHNFVMLSQAPRMIVGAITSLPPEVFKPWQHNRYFGGTYESWGLGMLLYRVLSLQNPVTFASLGEYASEVYSGALKSRLMERANELRELSIPGGLILPRLFEWAVNEEPESRPSISQIGRVMWDVRYESLSLVESRLLDQYFANPNEYEPEGGWRYSSIPDYD